MSPIQCQASSSNETTKSTADHLENVESSKTLSELLLSIPSTQEVDYTREEDSFSNTQEYSDDKESMVCLDGGGRGTDGSPNGRGRTNIWIG